MDIQVKQVADITVVTLIGEINGRNAPAIQEKLIPIAEPGCKLLLNMSGVTYMSSAGLRTLLILYRHIDRRNGCVALANLAEVIQDMMSVTGFLDFFDAYPTEADGLAALRDCETIGSQ